MPPRYVYWTILAGGLPTAFRAAEQEELLPTFHRLREKHPDAEMKYFRHGKLWASREEAEEGFRESRDRASRPAAGSRAERRAQPAADGTPPLPGPERRGKDWRPGGEHQDPRQPFKDAQREKNQDRRRERWERKQPGRVSGPRDGQPDRAARPDPLPEPPPESSSDQPPRPREPRSFDKPAGARPPGSRPWQDRPPRDREGPDRPPQKREWTARPPQKREWTARPPQKREWSPRPPGKPPRRRG